VSDIDIVVVYSLNALDPKRPIREAMVDRNHDLSITKQAEALNISRGSVYYLPRPVSATDLELMRRLDRLHLEFPFAGSRMLRGETCWPPKGARSAAGT
jgi:hypothetical protein